MTSPIAGSIGQGNGPLPVTDVLTADLGLIFDHLTGALTPDQMRGVEERLRTDEKFFDNVAPVVVAFTAPPPFLEKGGLRKVGKPLSKRERQAQWASLDSLFVPPVSSGSKWRRTALVLTIALPSVWAGAWGGIKYQERREAWPYAVADYRAGRALAPGASLKRPIMYQTAVGERQSVALPTADVHLGSMSRFSIGWQSIGAIDGQAEIVVHPGKQLALWVGDVPFIFHPGRFHLEHPLGPMARISVDSGSVTHKKDRYYAGAVIRIESRGTQTTIRARDPDGSERPTVTRSNFAIRP